MARKSVYASFPLLDALEATAAIIRVHGYISKKETAISGRQATAVTLGEWMKSPNTNSPVVGVADRRMAKIAVDWLADLAVSPKTGRENDFDMSMRGLVMGGYRKLAPGTICKSDFGFIACAYSTMERVNVRAVNQAEAKEAASTSEYMGSLKKRADFFVKLVGLNYSDNVGCYIYKIQDRKGNLGVFFSSDGDLAKVDDCFLAKMTPKRQGVSDYHGGKETVFNRVKVIQNVGATS